MEQEKIKRERPVCRCCKEVKKIAQLELCYFCLSRQCHCGNPGYMNEPEEKVVMEEILAGRDTPELWHWKRVFDFRREHNLTRK